MKSICLSIVRNEADIIEVFVRHHAKVFDHVFIIDHLSKDGTKDILNSLIKEGLPLTVTEENAYFHNQGNAITNRLKEIRKKYRPLLMMPLDADEFVIGDIKRAAWELPNPGNTLSVTWHNYGMTKDDSDDINVLKRITYKNKFINNLQHKPLIPGLVLDHDVYLQEGCHEVYTNGKIVRMIESKQIHLAHFPIRSAQQFMKKALVGWISKLANPANQGKAPDWSHWKLFFNLAKKGIEPSLNELQNLAFGYTFDHQLKEIQLEHSPVSCEGIDIKYPCGDKYPVFEALADTAELLASQLGSAL